MPNQRAPGQKLLPIAVDEKFLRELDAGLAQAGYRNRSQFIRDAIIEKLLRADISLPKELALPPHRIRISARASGREDRAPPWRSPFRSSALRPRAWRRGCSQPGSAAPAPLVRNRPSRAPALRQAPAAVRYLRRSEIGRASC